ncbi:putative WD repeat-containing protein alr3466 OS=Nostoc sp, (strain PCC 7120 / UTEX 2576) GN=alr3466 PE=4 SV=1 [Rhizoctonia solani AG-1 IB]|uniref:Putative WD repeat-containing protein alr3466 n=1 Tax=Thanatephorus cucumeris (strain AG1-IB / isolate 7/3/14) TaxID=1108050 RepID=A0A0B7G399_THACB|nr:putative WD repeat-containing protein alr3466 OS=Nostoc sp, (strain PCC 7120 / UTEX 2576) GN=alr3466 PE=4 SV=1 [Rhizoctonia solani AG-1 IB]
MSIRKAISRLGSTPRKKPRIGEQEDSPSISTPGSRASSVPPPESVGHSSGSSTPTQQDAPMTISGPSTLVDSTPGNISGARVRIRTLLAGLESSAGAFPPLASAIKSLTACFDILEGASKEHDEYEQLRLGLEDILNDLAEHYRTKSPKGVRITKSVQLICSDIEAEVRNIENIQTQNSGRRLMNALAGLDKIKDCYRRIDSHIKRLTLNTNIEVLDAVTEQAVEARLARMSPSMSATYNSAESADVQRRSCTPGTREPQIKSLLEWAQAPGTGRTYWMNGMAGTGKTTITHSVCTELDRTSRLGASFFCSRTIPECRQVKYIIPSIAYQLARFSHSFRDELVKALESDPDACSRAPKNQYENLIVGPLTAVQAYLPANFIVVIDALDECENDNAVGQILDLLLSSPDTMPIRYLVSSRPEKDIYGRMMSRAGARLVLHDLEPASVQTDIEAYMRDELKDIPLSKVQWKAILMRCGVLFIYASTLCLYIKQGHEMHNLDETVYAIMESASTPMTHGDERTIDELYMAILMNAFDKPKMSELNKTAAKGLLDSVICAAEPITLDVYADMLGLGDAKRVYALLQPLRSVNRSARFFCDQKTRNTGMAEACLRIITTAQPRFNICKLSSSYELDCEIEGLDEHVAKTISPQMNYASRCWSKHLNLGEYRPELINIVHDFFSSRLLVWMEVINLTKHKHLATSIIQEAEKWCTEYKAPEDLTALAQDASQFVSFFASNSVSKSTPHIYVSMLPFWPRSRPVSTAYMPRTSGLVRLTGTAIDRRQLALIATWKVSTRKVESMSLTADGGRLVVPSENSIEVYDTTTGESLLSLTDERARNVDYVAVSPDGTTVVFSRQDDTAYVWDMKNGGAVTKLLPDDIFGVFCIAFSCDGSRVACGLTNGDVYIRGLEQEAGAVVRLAGHTSYVNSVVFSPKGLHLASGSGDTAVRVWNIQTGQPVGEPFEGHTSWVRSVSYSDDGSRLASASSDNTIRVWDPQTGQTVLGPLTGHSNYVSSVSFSPGGAFIASGSYDHTIRVYDAHTGHTVLGPLHGHTSLVNWVKYSPDGTRLYSCSSDGTVRTWNVQDRGTSDTLSTASGVSTAIISVRYSHSGWHVVSGSFDGTVHVWDVGTGELVRGPLRGHENWVASVDYSPDDQYIASGSGDSTLRLWDATTGNDIHGPMRGHSKFVNCARFSADGLALVSGSDDGTVRMWDQAAVCGHDDWSHSGVVFSVCVSPNGLYVASGSFDGTVCVWDGQNGKRILGPLRGHTSLVLGVQFSPDGSHVVSCSYDGTIRFWDVSSIGGGVQEQGVTRAATAEEAKKNSNGSVALDQWSLDEDGWMVDSHGRRLLWVPSDLRAYLVHPLMSLSTGGRTHFHLESEGWKGGDKWMDCHQT